MSYSPAARRRLGEAVRSRREALGLSQRKLQPLGGPSVVTVGNIEKASGDEPSRLTLAAVERALRWQPGSAEAVLQGGEPVELPAEEQAKTGSVGPAGQGGEEILFRLPPDLTPRQREHARRMGEAAVRAYLETLDADEA